VAIHQKILAIMEAVDAIQRDKEISGSKASYKVVTEGQVLKTIRPLLVKHKMVMYPIEMSMSITGQLATVMGKYKLVDTETEEFVIFASVGAGYDPSDKMAGKAMTYCGKYAMLKPFLVATTDDDPDQFSSEANIEQEKIRKANLRENAAKTITTGKQLCDYIVDLVQKGKINAATGNSLCSKAIAIPEQDVEQLRQATAYVVGLDI
jgi:hypothetical protein